MPPRLIPVVDYSVALANKLAAWNERRLHRDLYDIWFFLQTGQTPDKNILLVRLKKPTYSPLLKKDSYFNGETVEEFYNFLREELSTLTDSDLARELSDYLEPKELAGLAMIIKGALVKLV